MPVPDVGTPLDKAVHALQNDIGTLEAFCELFFKTELFVPIADPVDEKDDGSTGISIIMVDNGTTMPVFDSGERLGNWAQREVRYAALSGLDLIEAMQPNDAIALNLGTTGFLLIPAEGIEDLLAHAAGRSKN